MRTRLPAVFFVFVLSFSAQAAVAQNTSITEQQLSELHFRQPGPAVSGGRIHDVEALPDDPSTIYVAAASGGIWKTTNKGTTWTPIFDDQPTSSMGDIAISRSNSNVLYVGTGGQNNRQSTSWGNGVYKSTDAGETWTHLGLVETRHIGRVRIHHTNPDIAFVAALGNLWRESEDRGVYRTTDGGGTWEKVLFIDEFTGAVDLVMDPNDSDVLYAATYQRQRRTWGFNGGGPGSGIYKTTDGGNTWTELTNGIPSGDKGRIGLAIAETNGQVINATIEHAGEAGIYRSENGGESWTRVNDLNQRPMYYSHLFIDPTNENRLYKLATTFYKSEDGGRTMEVMPSRQTYDVGVHSDFHTLWINPNDPEHFYLAGDGGLHESWDGGMTYIRLNNIPISQFYSFGLDNRDPYYIYGGLQDNHSFMGPSATRRWIGIVNDDWQQIGFGDGMYHQPDPTNHRYVYGNAQNGNIVRLDSETGDLLDVRPYPPAGEEQYRWDWVTPILISAHDPSTVYFGGNRLLISHNRGDSWERTPDLTKQVDRDTLEIMGVRGADIALSRNDGTSYYGEIVTIAESPLDPAILWVGADDGNIQVSRDGGETWNEVSGNISGAPYGTYVSRVIASRANLGAAFVTLDAHRDGDFRPYVYGTEDFGATWTELTNGLPEDGSVNVIREHPDNTNLLFLGTEHALFVSTNRGQHWTRFMPNLPTTLYDEIVIHPRENDLVLGTHGRSFWILDDVTPLVEWNGQVASSGAHLFSIRDAVIKMFWKDTSYRGQGAYAGENPPDGAILSFTSNNSGHGTIEITNAAGNTVRTLDVEVHAGNIERVVWDLRYDAPTTIQFGGGGEEPEGLPHPVGPRGHHVSPGTYTATLSVGRAQTSQDFVVRGDPERLVTDAQYRERETFLNEVHALLSELAERGGNDPALRRLRMQISGIYSELNGGGVRQGSLYPPTTTQRVRFAELKEAAR
ncbi:MAG: hypothetical protein OEY63_02900 [Gemmatimonadota bacterium]|nr:hypothetical protein [Gemmatimonadota bacterium]